MCFVVVLDITGAIIPLSQTEEYCGVRLVREKNQNLYVYSTYDSCYAQIEVNEGTVWKLLGGLNSVPLI